MMDIKMPVLLDLIGFLRGVNVIMHILALHSACLAQNKHPVLLDARTFITTCSKNNSSIESSLL